MIPQSLDSEWRQRDVPSTPRRLWFRQRRLAVHSNHLLPYCDAPHVGSIDGHTSLKGLTPMAALVNNVSVNHT